jgi:hypothetical protein
MHLDLPLNTCVTLVGFEILSLINCVMKKNYMHHVTIVTFFLCVALELHFLLHKYASCDFGHQIFCEDICRRFDPGGSLDRRVNCRCVSQPRWVGAKRDTRGKQ